MTGSFALDWAILAVSLQNTILLLWLGMTVLLNAERRTWGIWLAGGGLLAGGAFFVSHSAMLGHDLHDATLGMEFWWRVGWMPAVSLPLAWYVMVLWYAGYWADAHSPMRRSRWLWFALCDALALGVAGLFLFTDSLPAYSQVARLQWSVTPSIGQMPFLFLLYPVYAVLCAALSLDALRRPGLSTRRMDDLARQRARPWLVATSFVLLLVSLLVAGSMGWILTHARRRAIDAVPTGMSSTLGRLDLVISVLIALSVLSLGQAIVSHEVFTGRTLPRQGFLRSWRNAVFLAMGYSTVVSWGLLAQLRPIYLLLLTAVLMVVFYALLNWRSFAERERTMMHLRPFAVSQRLYDSVIEPGTTNVDAEALFHVLCDTVLGTQLAYLVPLGPWMPLLDHPMAFPRDRSLPWSSLLEMTARIESEREMYVPVDPTQHGGARWVVPLWSERGLIGALLLGAKREGGLYAEEEIEIARASGERLLDALAAVETARRLMALLRQRIAQVRVLEGQGRRVLHDQVLPQLHAAILYLGGLEANPAAAQAVEALTIAHHQISDLVRDIPPAVPRQLVESGLIAALHTYIDRNLGDGFTEVAWEIAPSAEAATRRLPLWVSEVVYFAAQELVRNAAGHGRGNVPGRPLRLRVALEEREGLFLTVEDDGVGSDPTRRSMHQDAEGSGQGLRFHSTMLMAAGARMEVTSLPSGGTRGLIVVPPGVAQEAVS